MERRGYSYDRETTRLLEGTRDVVLREDYSEHWTESLRLLQHHVQPTTELYLKSDLGEMFSYIVRQQPWTELDFVEVLEKGAASFEERGIQPFFSKHLRQLESLVRNQRDVAAADALQIIGVTRSIVRTLPSRVDVGVGNAASMEDVREAEEKLISGKEAIQVHYEKIKTQIETEIHGQRGSYSHPRYDERPYRSGWKDNAFRNSSDEQRDFYGGESYAYGHRDHEPPVNDHYGRGEDRYGGYLCEGPRSSGGWGRGWQSPRRVYSENDRPDYDRRSDFDRRGNDHGLERNENYRGSYERTSRGSEMLGRSRRYGNEPDYNATYPSSSTLFRNAGLSQTACMQLPKRPPKSHGPQGPSRTAAENYPPRGSPRWGGQTNEPFERSLSDPDRRHLERHPSSELREDPYRFQGRGSTTSRTFSARQGFGRHSGGRDELERSRSFDSKGSFDRQPRSPGWGNNARSQPGVFQQSGWGGADASSRSSASSGHGSKGRHSYRNKEAQRTDETGWGPGSEKRTDSSGSGSGRRGSRTSEKAKAKPQKDESTNQDVCGSSVETPPMENNPWGMVSDEVSDGPSAWGHTVQEVIPEEGTVPLNDTQTPQSVWAESGGSEPVFGASTAWVSTTDSEAPVGDARSAATTDTAAPEGTPWGTSVESIAEKPVEENPWGAPAEPHASQDNPWGAPAESALEKTAEVNAGRVSTPLQSTEENPQELLVEPLENLTVQDNAWGSSTQVPATEDNPWGVPMDSSAEIPMEGNPWGIPMEPVGEQESPLSADTSCVPPSHHISEEATTDPSGETQTAGQLEPLPETSTKLDGYVSEDEDMEAEDDNNKQDGLPTHTVDQDSVAYVTGDRDGAGSLREKGAGVEPTTLQGPSDFVNSISQGTGSISEGMNVWNARATFDKLTWSSTYSLKSDPPEESTNFGSRQMFETNQEEKHISDSSGSGSMASSSASSSSRRLGPPPGFESFAMRRNPSLN